jgi:hypothetical protein
VPAPTPSASAASSADLVPPPVVIDPAPPAKVIASSSPSASASSAPATTTRAVKDAGAPAVTPARRTAPSTPRGPTKLGNGTKSEADDEYGF